MPLNSRKATGRPFVVYWMQAAQRAEANHALEYAARAANELRKPLAVLFVLTEAYPEANERHYAFMLEGLKETREALSRRGIPLVVRKGDPAAEAAAFGRARRPDGRRRRLRPGRAVLAQGGGGRARVPPDRGRDERHRPGRERLRPRKNMPPPPCGRRSTGRSAGSWRRSGDAPAGRVGRARRREPGHRRYGRRPGRARRRPLDRAIDVPARRSVGSGAAPPDLRREEARRLRRGPERPVPRRRCPA